MDRSARMKRQRARRPCVGSIPRARMTAPALDLDGHLVGRQSELARLEAVFEAAERHGGGLVLLSGVPGVGQVHARPRVR